MPRWTVKCPKCSHEFTHTEIDARMLQQAYENQYGVLPKPSGGKRTCPSCNVESAFERTDLVYRKDARGQAS
jgi:endogenous inhibitor of DNA gyrase (YacG/DUF329 family)